MKRALHLGMLLVVLLAGVSPASATLSRSPGIDDHFTVNQPGSLPLVASNGDLKRGEKAVTLGLTSLHAVPSHAGPVLETLDPGAIVTLFHDVDMGNDETWWIVLVDGTNDLGFVTESNLAPLTLTDPTPTATAASDHPAVIPLPPLDGTVPRDGLSIGDPNAPVSIVEYGDYQCPFCAIADDEGFRPMLDQYIATGQVFFTYVPMSFLGDESKDAAEAALCANDQGKFWEMHETIYANHIGENQGAYARSRLNTMAENMGLNMEQFNSCMDEGKNADAVQDYDNQATQAGITSTPTFVINNGVPVGWSSWEGMRRLIEAALDDAPSS